MNREEFISYIKNPSSLDKNSLGEINELLEEFPYFQSGHLLFLKNLHQLDHIRFSGQLKKSAAFVANREVLYRLLYDYNEPKDKIPEAVYNKPEEKQLTAPEEKDESKLADDFSKEVQLSKDEVIPEPIIEKKPDPAIEEKSTSEEKLSTDDSPRSKEELAAELKKRLKEIKESGKAEKENNDQIEEEILQLSDEQAVDASVLQDIKEPDSSSKSEINQTDLLDLEAEKKETSLPEKPHESPNFNKDQANNKAKKKKLRNEQNKAEAHSFSSWLSLLNNPDQVERKIIVEHPENTKLRQLEIIDKFIEDNPRITPVQEKSNKTDDMSVKSIEEKEEMFTETLAHIYIKQGYFSKALFIYKKLSLKFPEKSSYFAGRIKIIEKQINEL